MLPAGHTLDASRMLGRLVVVVVVVGVTGAFAP